MKPVEYFVVDETGFDELRLRVKTPKSNNTYRIDPDTAEGLARQILAITEDAEGRTAGGGGD